MNMTRNRSGHQSSTRSCNGSRWESSTLSHYWPKIVQAKFFPLVKMWFLLDSSSKNPILRMTCTLQRFVKGRNNTGASIPPSTSADVVLPMIVDCPPNSTDLRETNAHRSKEVWSA
jgi:hypothetical protein